MGLSVGIVGLPNVGKSTLFNALTKQNVLAANYPFATIDPNSGIVPVPDDRLYNIAAISKPQKIVPATVEFIDIAGLVKDASKGAGLGNKFLSHIRNVDIVCHLVRAFVNNSITHVEQTIDPIRDINLIETELILKDLETINNRISNIKNKARLDKFAAQELTELELLQKNLNNGIPARNIEKPQNEYLIKQRQSLFLLSDKPVLYIFNSTDLQFKPNIENIENYIVLDVLTEMELSTMSEEDRLEFMKDLSIEKPGLDKLILKAYYMLGLISFFTEGSDEVRAWTITKDSKAPSAAGVIHTDFQHKFIAAEVCKYDDFINLKGWSNAKENGKVRLEGKEYIVKDGDIIVFRHG